MMEVKVPFHFSKELRKKIGGLLQDNFIDNLNNLVLKCCSLNIHNYSLNLLILTAKSIIQNLVWSFDIRGFIDNISFSLNYTSKKRKI